MEREFHIDDIDEGINLGNAIHIDASKDRSNIFDEDKSSREISSRAKSVKLILDGDIGSVLDKTRVLEIPNYDMLIKNRDIDLGIRVSEEDSSEFFDGYRKNQESEKNMYMDNSKYRVSIQDIDEANESDSIEEESVEDIFGNRITIQYNPDSNSEASDLDKIDIDNTDKGESSDNRIYYGNFEDSIKMESLQYNIEDEHNAIDYENRETNNTDDIEKKTDGINSDKEEDIDVEENSEKPRPKIIFEGSTPASERPSIDDIPQFFDSNDEFKNIRFMDDDTSDGDSGNSSGGASDDDYDNYHTRMRKHKETFFEVLKNVFMNMLKEKPYTVINTILGMVVGVLVLTIGWQKTLVFVLVVLVFNVFGQIMDRNERVLSIIEMIRGLIKHGN